MNAPREEVLEELIRICRALGKPATKYKRELAELKTKSS